MFEGPSRQPLTPVMSYPRFCPRNSLVTDTCYNPANFHSCLYFSFSNGLVSHVA